jgi:competence protein ComEC
MLTVIIIGWLFKRPSDLINSLFAAVLIILTWEPRQLFQAGFQLSFVVVLCIILLIPVFQRLAQRLTTPDPLVPESLRPRWRQTARVPLRWLGGLLLTSLAAWIGSLPLVAYYFHIVSSVSTPANMLAVPLCGLVLICNLSTLLLASWFPAAAESFNHAGWWWMECIRVSSGWFAHWPRAYAYVAAPGLFTIVLYYALLLAVATGWLWRERLRFLKITAAFTAICIWCILCWQERSTTRLSILEVNGGDAIYFDPPGAQNHLLIDGGTTNAVRSITKPFLRAQGVNRLPRLLLSHGDLHHVGGAELLKDLFSVKQVCASPVRFRSPTYRQILGDFNRTPGLVRTITRTDQVGPWSVIHPKTDDHFSQADDNAIVLSAVIQGTRILLVSDLGALGQSALLGRSPDLRADIVVSGLPTASEALADPFLDAIQPRVIIISDAEVPISEHASRKLSERLACRKIPVIYTRLTGSATIEFHPNQWMIRTMSGLRISSRDGAGPSPASVRTPRHSPRLSSTEFFSVNPFPPC